MKVIWKVEGGDEFSADVEAGTTLKDAAMAQNVPYILGECGGSMSCATCHVVVTPGWVAATGAPGEFEDAVLDATEAPRQDNSRLSCQITMRDDLDGLVLIVPAP